MNGCNPDFLNVDLTATRKFGDWEFGVVAFGSTDLIPSPIDQNWCAQWRNPMDMTRQG